MKWRALGQVFKTDSYGQTPTPLVLDDRVRVYIAERDPRGNAFISYLDLDLENPTMLLGMHRPSAQVLSNGLPGTFDDEGQMPSFAMRNGENVNLYYSGWNTRNTVPYHNATGVAVSFDSGQTFERPFEGPILDRTPEEPYLAVTPSLCAGKTFYVSGIRWDMIDGRYEPIYVICSAESKDGVHWKRDGVPMIPQNHPQECFSRPWVINSGALWHMWYCYRSALDYRDGRGAYRIGYAISIDGRDWQRKDDEFELKRSDWDATMQCYPAVFQASGRLWMLYNGNTFGRKGFGLAVAE